MKLYVLRHAIAEDASPGQRDADRELTDEGREKARRVLAHACRIGVRPKTILTSPYPRAAETAEIACEELGFSGRPLVTDALIGFTNVADVWSEIRDHAPGGDVMVVGHNPQLSALVAWLIGARPDALWLKKSAIAALDIGPAGPQPRTSLSWLLTPGSVGR